MEDDAREQEIQNLRTAIWYSVEQIAQHEADTIGKTLTQDFVASLADVVYKQIESMATDLEAFAKHNSKRSVINVEDVKLLARRNNSLHQLICETAEQISREHGRGGGDGRRRRQQ
ncbi:hypothetical protein VTP01DRAFT_4552 [Rhizomucor pusillus]|uniref:uncharacterized protein n=1 Tax=Rhizomucor pusillus TaxID=4840 RepID=UPI0037441A07